MSFVAHSSQKMAKPEVTYSLPRICNFFLEIEELCVYVCVMVGVGVVGLVGGIW